MDACLHAACSHPSIRQPERRWCCLDCRDREPWSRLIVQLRAAEEKLFNARHYSSDYFDDIFTFFSWFYLISTRSAANTPWFVLTGGGVDWPPPTSAFQHTYVIVSRLTTSHGRPPKFFWQLEHCNTQWLVEIPSRSRLHTGTSVNFVLLTNFICLISVKSFKCVPTSIQIPQPTSYLS